NPSTEAAKDPALPAQPEFRSLLLRSNDHYRASTTRLTPRGPSAKQQLRQSQMFASGHETVAVPEPFDVLYRGRPFARTSAFEGSRHAVDDRNHWKANVPDRARSLTCLEHPIH